MTINSVIELFLAIVNCNFSGDGGSVRPIIFAIFDNAEIFCMSICFSQKNQSMKKHTQAYF
jgi:hypothetical protein